MKRLFISSIAAGALFASCNKLVEDPKSLITSSQFYKTQADAVAAVNSVYARLKGPAVGDNFDYWTVRHFALTDLTTDLGHCSYGGDPGQLSLAIWNSTRSAGQISRVMCRYTGQ